MATWKGDPKKFEVEYVPNNPNQHWYDPEWGELSFRWEYGTVSDTLSIYVEHPNMTTRQDIYGPDWAEAQLFTLASYYATYVGREELKNLLKDLLEE